MNALIKKGMLVTALALSVNTAMAAQSIDIKVTGKSFHHHVPQPSQAVAVWLTSVP